MFESSGEITPPCGVPAIDRRTSPSSITPAWSHLRTSLSTRLSETRSATSAEQPLMIDRREVVPDVGLKHELVPVDERATQHLLRLRGRPTRPKPKRDRQEVGLEDGFEHDARGLLSKPDHERSGSPAAAPRPGAWGSPPAEPAAGDNDPHGDHVAARPTGAPPRTPPPPPASAYRPRQHPCSSAHAATPPTGRHSCRSGQTGRESVYPATAWRPPIACAEALAHPRQSPPRRFRWQDRRAHSPAGLLGRTVSAMP